ncbi:MAG: acetolactate synthase small subunit [Candidatus Omnitrophica bacterium CG11_big_fil_rev_8_21_14_0_20_42_13]|uniref:Acetolactate synthase small subunit n=1 Tax=Candidatus Ghiorseimicrobium undicola TaxID=1974746 RepID=A0A2H0LWP2_9BACT|nr:MAG: acetolactate synthase small subunit [Candidatus Omnitrophica bacterium CG11_big_fil_rev_8_21_14_0_20_42_13]
MKHTIQALVENRFGVLARISGLFSARGFNIISLAVGETEDPSVSRMTLLVDAKDERILDQIKKQLNKLIDVITVVDLTGKDFFDRELMLFKVNFTKENKKDIDKLAKEFGAKILETKDSYAVIEICSDQHTALNFLKEIKPFGIKELVRTGRIAIIK